MKKEIRTTLLVALLFILFCVGVSAADYTTKAGIKSSKAGGSMSQSVKDLCEQPAGLASVKDQADHQAVVSSKDNLIQMDGTIIELLPNAIYRVELQNGKQVTAHLSGKLRMNFIRIHIGDKVMIDMLSSDQSKGRVIWRYK